MLKKIFKVLILIFSFSLSGYLMYLTILKSGFSIQNSEIRLSTYTIPLILSSSAYIICNYFHSRRFWLIWNEKRIKTYFSLLIGRFFNSIYPGQIGEAIRAWHFHKKNHKPILPTISSLMLEKFLDAVFALPMMLIFLLVQPNFPFEISKYIYLTTGLVLTFLITLICLIKNKNIVKSVLSVLPKFAQSTKYIYKLFISLNIQIRGLLQTRNILSYFGYSYFLALINLAQSFCIFYALNITDIGHSLMLSWMCTFMIMIISMVPSAPSAVGVLHYGLYISIEAYLISQNIYIDDVARSKIAIFTFIFHLGQLLPDLALGAIASIMDWKYLFTFMKSKELSNS